MFVFLMETEAKSAPFFESEGFLHLIKTSKMITGFWTFSIVWYSGKHDVSETGSVSVLRWRWGRRHLLSWAT
jgi:hypothetical protein